jgi:hypothetical protein
MDMEKDKTEEKNKNKNREQKMEQDKTGEKTENKDREQKNEELHRITVSKQAERALSTVVERVNEGFSGGKVNRTQMANWILARFNDTLTETEIKEIRVEHFDEVAMLENILRQAKESGKVPAEFKGLLQKHLGMDEAQKKRTKKALTGDIINDDIK